MPHRKPSTSTKDERRAQEPAGHKPPRVVSIEELKEMHRRGAKVVLISIKLGDRVLWEAPDDSANGLPDGSG